jgi:FlaA1/EpsC-like NDP-sugar epimerase
MRLTSTVMQFVKPSGKYKRFLRYATSDFLITLIAYAITVSIRVLSSALNPAATISLALFAALLMVISLYAFGVYQRIWPKTSGHDIDIIVYAVMTMSIIMSTVVLLLDQQPLPLIMVLLSNGLALVGVVATRYRSRLLSGGMRRWRQVVRRGKQKVTTVLIIGAGESGQALALRFRQHRWSSDTFHKVVGFIDDDPEKQGMYVEGCRVLGTRQDIERIAEENSVELIIVAVHNISGVGFRDILTRCERTSAMIKVVPDIFDLMSARKGVTLLRDVQAEDLLGRNIIGRHEAVDLSPVTHKVILVTGAAGSIGSELSRQIMGYAPTKVILLDNNESGLYDLEMELQAAYPQIELIPALVDITQMETLEAVFDVHRPQVVFHAAAYKHVPMLERYPREAVRVNIGGTRNVAYLADLCGVERFVLISTDKAVNPSSVMGASKRACELLLHALSSQGSRTLFTSVRFGNVLGSRGSVVPLFNRQIDRGGPVTVTHRDMTRYFMSIPEAVNLIIHAASLTQGDNIYILQMGEVVRIVDLAERMIRLRGLRPYEDIQVEFCGIRPGEKMHEELFYGDEMPQPTIHPGIIQLNRWDARFEAGHYLVALDQLHEGKFTPPEIRQALFTLAGRHTPQAMSNGKHH